MIHFNLNIRDPFTSMFDTLKSWTGKLSENKAWEVELYQSSSIIEIGLNITFRQDHAGIQIDFGLFGFTISGSIYDVRHWDSIANKWEE